MVAENAGFCFGVDRAVKMAEELAAQGGESWCRSAGTPIALGHMTV